MLAFRKFAFTSIVVAMAAVSAQTTPPPAAQTKPDKADAYYYYSLGHLYSELAGAYSNSSEYLNKAIESYRKAIKADPSASFISEELSDLYLQSGRLREAVTDAEEAIKQNPSDLNSRRLLARIYARLIGDPQQRSIDSSMLKKAIEQYQKITEGDPSDTDSWLMLGRLDKLAQNSVDAQKAYKKVLEIDPDNEDAMTGLAMVYADVGDTKAASDLLRKAAEKSPSLRSLTTLAGMYEQMKDYALAAETYRRALDLQPGNAEIQRALAQNLLFSDRYDDALKIYTALLADDPKDVQSQLRISQIYRAKGDITKSKEAAEKAREIDPTNIEVRYNEVNVLEAEGKTADAIAAIKSMLEDTPKGSGLERSGRATLLQRLGELYRKNEQYQLAQDTFKELAQTDPDSASRAAVEEVETYRASRDFTKALEQADAALAKFPQDAIVRNSHAAILADMGRYDQAIAEMKKLVAERSDRESYLALAQIYDKAKNFPEMAKALDQAERLSNSSDEKKGIYFMRGAMYEKQKKYDAAEAEFKKVLGIDPGSREALNYLGYMLADRNVRLQEAQSLIQKALDLDPKNGSYLDSLGWVYFRQNKLSEAEDLLKRALDQIPDDATIHDHLGDVLFHEGKLRDAIVHWQYSLKQWERSAPAEMDEVEVAKIQKKLEGAKVRLARENGARKP